MLCTSLAYYRSKAIFIVISSVLRHLVSLDKIFDFGKSFVSGDVNQMCCKIVGHLQVTWQILNLLKILYNVCDISVAAA